MLQVTLIPGDGVGAEIIDSVKEIFEHVNAPIEWEQYDVSGMSSAGEDLFKQAMDSLKRNRVGLKGTICSSDLTDILRVENSRHSLYAHLPVRPHFMERCHASTT
jgi:isocitrate/isopropylmalate dehydrogenase